MKKVLIAVDYEPTAQKVVEEGYLFASAMNAHIILLHVIPTERYYYSNTYSPIMGFLGYSYLDSQESNIIQKLVSETYGFLENIKNHLSDDDIETKVIQGNVAETIVRTATKSEVSFIVMGTHSHSKHNDVFMGNIAEEVVKISKMPIVLIPTKPDKE